MNGHADPSNRLRIQWDAKVEIRDKFNQPDECQRTMFKALKNTDLVLKDTDLVLKDTDFTMDGSAIRRLTFMFINTSIEP